MRVIFFVLASVEWLCRFPAFPVFLSPAFWTVRSNYFGCSRNPKANRIPSVDMAQN